MQPLIIGHRGAAAVAPENTLVSFQRAFADGADGIEFDVQLSRDGVPVIIHDETLRRTTDEPGRVRNCTVAELKSVDAGSWFARRYPDLARPEYIGATIPTLAEVFAACPRGWLYIELKCAPQCGAQLAATVAKMVQEHNLAHRIVIESFAHDAIAEVKRHAPELRTAALFDINWRRLLPSGWRFVAAAQAINADEIALHTSLITRKVVADAQAHGLPVVVWTADAPSWARKAQTYGLHAIITNHPQQMRAAFDHKSPPINADGLR